MLTQTHTQVWILKGIYIYIYIYIYILKRLFDIPYYIMLPMGVEHYGERIYDWGSHNAKLFERIEHSGIRYDIKCKQTNATT